MSTIDTADGTKVRKPLGTRKMVAGGAIGTGIEYYDYYLYGLGAAAIFPRVFFPMDNPVIASLASFASFAVGFLLRPLGGVVFGHIGDRFGRKTTLMITVIGMGLSTAAIGVIPSASTIGIAAPLLLLLMRVLQGLFVGGEMGGAATLVSEQAPAARRGFFVGFLMTAGGLANIISAGLMAALGGGSKEFFDTWGWRFPFLFSIVLVVVAVVLRRQLEDSAEFTEMLKKQEAEEKRSLPIREVFRHPRNLILAILVGVPASIVTYVILTFGLSYMVSKGAAAQIGFVGTMLVGILQVFAAPFWGWLSDKIGRKRVYIGACILLCIVIYPVFALFGTGNPWLIWLGMIIGVVIPGVCLMTLEEVMLPEMFDAESRTTGVNIGYQVSAALFGGFAPFICEALVAGAGGIWPVGLYVIVLSLVGLVATIFVRLRPSGEAAAV